MKRIAIAVGVVGLIFGGVILAQTQTPSVEQELIKLEHGWADALVNEDWRFLDRILVDDFISTDEDGNVSTKDVAMAAVTAILEGGVKPISSAVADDFKVHIYGDVSVVNYRLTTKSYFKGKENIGLERITDTWVKRGSRWQCVASHYSRIVQK